jgi:hypothetical protein
MVSGDWSGNSLPIGGTVSMMDDGSGTGVAVGVAVDWGAKNGTLGELGRVGVAPQLVKTNNRIKMGNGQILNRRMEVS